VHEKCRKTKDFVPKHQNQLDFFLFMCKNLKTCRKLSWYFTVVVFSVSS